MLHYRAESDTCVGLQSQERIMISYIDGNWSPAIVVQRRGERVTYILLARALRHVDKKVETYYESGEEGCIGVERTRVPTDEEVELFSA